MADFDKISINGTYYNVKDTAAWQQLAKETDAREAADTALGQQITKESEGREAADTALGQQITEALAKAVKTVRDYGAKGDGVTDDTAAFTACLAENTVCVVPEGRYRITGNIDISGKTMMGIGNNNKYLQPTLNGNVVLVLSNSITAYSCAVKNICFMTAAPTTPANYDCFVNSNAADFDIDIVGCAFYGFRYVLSGKNVVRLHDCMIAYCKVGIYNIEDSLISHCYIWNCTEGAIRFEGKGASCVVNCKIEWNGGTSGYGIAVMNIPQVTITNTIFDRNGATNLILNGASYCIVSGCILVRAATYNLQMSNCTGCVVYATSYAKNQNDDDTSPTVPAVGTVLANNKNSKAEQFGNVTTPYQQDNTSQNSTFYYNNNAI